MIVIFSHALLCYPFSQSSKKATEITSAEESWQSVRSLPKKVWRRIPIRVLESLLRLCSIITEDGDCSHEIKRYLLLGRKAWETALKNRGITLLTKVHIVKAMVFSSSHVWIWQLDHKEGWAPKNSCFWIMVLEKTLDSPLGFKEIKLVNPKGNQNWIFIGRTDAESETLILWPPDSESWLMEKEWWQKETEAA